jgi:beta-galactosidase
MGTCSWTVPRQRLFRFAGVFVLVCAFSLVYAQKTPSPLRQRLSLNEGWRFMRYSGEPDDLSYDERPNVSGNNDNVVADTRAADTGKAASSGNVLKNWILPTANAFIADPAKRHLRPAGNPGGDFPLVQVSFDDKAWEKVSLPHDWAAKGPFYKDPDPEVGGGMGRLPTQGVAWYRRRLSIPATDKGKSIYLDIDGAIRPFKRRFLIN